jgi:hypothetical protein
MSMGFILSFLFFFGFITPPLLAQNPEEVRRAFVDLHDDKVPHNCDHATEWLFKYREQLKDQLLEELYKTDWQGRDAICYLLYNTSSFVPDERFIRQAFTLLRNDDVPGNGQETIKWLSGRIEQVMPLLLDELYKTDKQAQHTISHLLYDTKSFVPDERFIALVAAKFAGNEDMDAGDCRFVCDHFDLFEPLLEKQIAKAGREPHDMFMIWVTAWIMKKRGILDHGADAFTPAVLATAAANLRNDNKSSNAGWAVRLFLLLGDKSLPVLRDTMQSSDPQARSLAKATIDALNGSRTGFGYLQARVELSRTPFGPEVADPAWLATASEPYRDNNKLY